MKNEMYYEIPECWRGHKLSLIYKRNDRESVRVIDFDDFYTACQRSVIALLNVTAADRASGAFSYVVADYDKASGRYAAKLYDALEVCDRIKNARK